MLKLLGPMSGPPGSDERRPLVLAACECARLALPYVPNGETRPLAAIKAAERWAHGKGIFQRWFMRVPWQSVTLEQVQRAADDAAHAASAADPAADTAAYAAYYAAHAAYVAVPDIAAYAAKLAAAAHYAAHAAYVAAYAAKVATADAHAAADVARAHALRKCAAIVRRHFPEPPTAVAKP
jgi:hypothetical protein